MSSRKSTKTQVTTSTPLFVPASRPRNRLALDPLLKKSGPHSDNRSKRLHAAAGEHKQGISDAMLSRDEDE